MPKMKSHKGISKRIKMSANGKLRYKQPNTGHLMSSKSGNRCRNLRRKSRLHGEIAERVRIKLLQA